MTYEELVQQIKEAVQKQDASHITEHAAIEIDIRGEAEGALYLELREGKVIVEPYEYYDRDLLVTTTAEVALSIARGQLRVEDAYRTGLLHARGALDKAYLFDDVLYNQ